jgi:hypothetical protein
MTFFTDGNAFFRRGVLAAAGLALLAVSACKSGPTSKGANGKSGAQPNSAATAQGSGGAGIDLNCVMDHIQNPPEAFHYSYNKESSNPVHEEADITPQTIDGSFKNNSASSSFHGVHSDAASWQGAWSSLMGIAGMSEKVNGYDAIKYSIDTARGTDAEKSLYQSVLGTGGFQKGTAWVTSQGCPAKLVMDSELHGKDGSVEKIHYDVAMVRK